MPQKGTAASASKTAARHADASTAAAVTGPQALSQLGATASRHDAVDGATEIRQSGPSRGKRSKQGRVDEDSQTEYVVIPPKAKKRSRDLLTEHQREVAQRQRQGGLLAIHLRERSVARSD